VFDFLVLYFLIAVMKRVVSRAVDRVEKRELVGVVAFGVGWDGLG
jgi:Na+-transporting methylmalonyl-CoA/oxaloacetate decarboxylase gamma subunit